MSTTIRIECPICHKVIKAPEKYAGQEVKCPGCSHSLTIPSQVGSASATISSAGASNHNRIASASTAAVAPPPPPPPQKTRAKLGGASDAIASGSRQSEQSKRSGLPVWAIVLLTALPSLGLGYYGGREHLRYQMLDGLKKVGQSFASASQGTSAARGSDSDEAGGLGASITDNFDGDDNDDAPVIDMGESYSADHFDLRVVSSQIAITKVESSLGGGEGKTPDLQIMLEVVNTHDRKIVRYRDNQFMAKFVLHDDVDNHIRGISYGMSNPVGALSNGDDILPGETATHVEVFKVPPPSTEHLTLTVDLEAFGEEGEVKFRIPFDQVKK